MQSLSSRWQGIGRVAQHRSIDFDPTDFISFVMFWDSFFSLFHVRFSYSPIFPCRSSRHMNMKIFYQEFDHLLSIIIETERERKRQKRKQQKKRKREILRIFSLSREKRNEYK